MPTDVVFLTSGAAMVTSQFKEEARLRKLDVMQLCLGWTVETGTFEDFLDATLHNPARAGA